MKTLKTRLISTLLVVMTLLSLLPTTAFAATGTGKGITITTNQVYWSTRILANGTPYSYRPPEAAGRLLYCLDSGLGYHNATPSYCDSFTYTSATNADADAVLKTAVANSGLGEMDAATLANVKWLMTYINDSKASKAIRAPEMAPEMRVVMPTRTPMTCIWASSTPCLRRRRGRMPNFSVKSQNMQREDRSPP